MRRFTSQVRMLAVASAIAILVAATFAWSQRSTTAQDTQYEYWLVEVNIAGSTFPSRVVQERLNQLGRDGWELVELREAIGNENVFWLFMQQETH